MLDDSSPGELAALAELLGDAGINITSCVSIDVHATWAIVAMAFEDGQASPTPERSSRRSWTSNGRPRWPILPEHGGRDRRRKVDDEPGKKFKKGDL